VDDMSLVTLARSLRLIATIQDLVLTNRSLRAVWDERKVPILRMARDLATGSHGEEACCGFVGGRC